MQCDFDTIGTTSIAADIETALVIHELLLAVGIQKFSIHVNNRKVLNGVLEKLELTEQSTAILRALDKLAKIGPEGVTNELRREANATTAQAAEVLRLSELNGSSDDILSQLDGLVAGSDSGAQGVSELRDVLAGAKAGGVLAERIQLDVAIARGLDYYTGVVYETFLDDLPTIGSICSGGRYDNLAGVYSKQELPGIGTSLGLDRLLAALEELGLVDDVRTPAQVFIPFFAKNALHSYLGMAAALRSAGFGVELYPEPRKLGQQLKYADQRGFRLALIAGEDELAKQTCQLKDLTSGQSRELPVEQPPQTIISALHEILDV